MWGVFVLCPLLVSCALRLLARLLLPGRARGGPAWRVAQELARDAGLEVSVVGAPWDAYSASRREVCLSDRVRWSDEAWASAVAAHEVGHAAEHGRGGRVLFLVASGEMAGLGLIAALVSLAAAARLPGAGAAVAVLAAGAGVPLAVLELAAEARASLWGVKALRGGVPLAGLLLWYLGCLASHSLHLGLWLLACGPLAVGGGAGVELFLPSGLVGACAATAVWAAVVLHYRRLAGALGKDPLTGCLVRRVAERELERLGRRRAGLVVVDADGLKAVNDGLGHGAGDELLRRLGEALRRCVRRGDLVARWGGDEFLLVLPGVGEGELAVVVGRLRRALSEAGLSASVGWALASSGEELRECLARADAAMYAEKARKRLAVSC